MKKYAVSFFCLFVFMLAGCDFLFQANPNTNSSKTNSNQTATDHNKKPSLKSVAKLTIHNQSTKVLNTVRYSGGSPSSSSKSLRPGDLCTIEIANGPGTGSIFFTIDGNSFKTNEVISIPAGKSETFTFHDSTVIINSSGKEKTLGNYDDKTILTIMNSSSKRLSNVEYTGEKLLQPGMLAPGYSGSITLKHGEGNGSITFKIGRAELRTKETYSLKQGEMRTVSLTDTTVVFDESGNEGILNNFFDDTVLTLKNDSMYVLEKIRYSGKEPKGGGDILSRGSTCEIYLDSAGSGVVSFEIDGKPVTTKESVSLERETRQELTINDNTEIIDTGSGRVTTVKGLYPDTILTIENTSTKALRRVEYGSTQLEGNLSVLAPGASGIINLGKRSGDSSISFIYNDTLYDVIEKIMVVKGTQNTVYKIEGGTLVRGRYFPHQEKHVKDL